MEEHYEWILVEGWGILKKCCGAALTSEHWRKLGCKILENMCKYFPVYINVMNGQGGKKINKRGDL